jgi:hypothetical protein
VPVIASGPSSNKWSGRSATSYRSSGRILASRGGRDSDNFFIPFRRTWPESVTVSSSPSTIDAAKHPTGFRVSIRSFRTTSRIISWSVARVANRPPSTATVCHRRRCSGDRFGVVLPLLGSPLSPRPCAILESSGGSGIPTPAIAGVESSPINNVDPIMPWWQVMWP